MYRVDLQNRKLIEIPVTAFSALNLRERFDIQEWISGTPKILGEELLILSKELFLPSGKRLDLLAVDKQGALVIVELKRDDSGSDADWQSIKYASYCSSFTQDEIYKTFAEYLGSNDDDAQVKIEEFIDTELEALNQQQRIILVSKEFNSEVISAVLWLREFEIDIACVKLTPHLDGSGSLFVNSEIIIPLPEAKNYIQKKETKQKVQRDPGKSSFSLEKANLPADELKEKILQSLTRASDLTPRLRAFLEIIVQEARAYDREEVKAALQEAGIGDDIGQTGRYLSNISQFLTKKSNPHLRQIIDFESGGFHGQIKNNYRVLPEYRDLLIKSLEETATRMNSEGQQANRGDRE